jgi:hypothetical protein
LAAASLQEQVDSPEETLQQSPALRMNRALRTINMHQARKPSAFLRAKNLRDVMKQIYNPGAADDDQQKEK